MTEVSNANRRTHARRASRIAADLTHEDVRVEGRVENIGEGGVFFATEDLELALEEGATVAVHLTCRRDGAKSAVERTGTVLRTERYFDGESVVRAFAVKFDELLDLAGVDFE